MQDFIIEILKEGKVIAEIPIKAISHEEADYLSPFIASVFDLTYSIRVRSSAG